MPEFEWTNDLDGLVHSLVSEHHKHLEGVPIRVVWRERVKKRNNLFVWATAERCSGRFASLTIAESERAMLEEIGIDRDAYFLIEVHRETWDTLTEPQRKALMDHELSHCVLTESEASGLTLDIVGHDVEEFEAIVRRHGPWTDSLDRFSAALLRMEGT